MKKERDLFTEKKSTREILEDMYGEDPRVSAGCNAMEQEKPLVEVESDLEKAHKQLFAEFPVEYEKAYRDGYCQPHAELIVLDATKAERFRKLCITAEIASSY